MGTLNDSRLPYNYHTREWGTVPPDKKRAGFQWVSEVAYKNVHRIVSRGYDTTELVEAGYGLLDMIFIDFQARIPTLEEVQMLNYIMVMGLEDGLSGPAVMARVVAQGKNLLTQAAGASILAYGHAFGAFSAFGNMMNKYLDKVAKDGMSTAQAAELLVRENLKDEALGVSDLMLKDPSAKNMIARAEKLGVSGKYTDMLKAVAAAAQKASSTPVDVDMLGATGAIMLDMDFSPEATWAVMAVCRAFASGSHYCEENERESYQRLGEVLTPKEWYDGPADRPVPSLEERAKTAKPTRCLTPEEWKKAFDEKQKMVGTGWAIVEEIEVPKTAFKKGKDVKKSSSKIESIAPESCSKTSEQMKAK
ncbi:MAG: hypothetical protein JXD22_04395 [Sedimentisphaerales bacterium]|nr:hypothetical protein [Sedimentisphaerales bacterium]